VLPSRPCAKRAIKLDGRTEASVSAVQKSYRGESQLLFRYWRSITAIPALIGAHAAALQGSYRDRMLAPIITSGPTIGDMISAAARFEVAEQQLPKQYDDFLRF